MTTIINLAQNFIGSNNLNLLQPIGQFGSRLQGGKDAANPRHIYTMMSPLTRLIFHPHDDPLLKYLKDDDQKIEPVWYIPIIPMLLVNGASGIGAGWMTKIPNYNTREIIEVLKKMMDGEEPSNLIPWYKNFRGDIEPLGTDSYMCSGEISVEGDDKLEITELPIGTWTQAYKESVLKPMLHGKKHKEPSINDYKDYSTDTTIRFVVTLPADKLLELEDKGLHKAFKLQTTLSITSMCALDKDNVLKKYDEIKTILKEFYDLRLEYYDQRKNYLEGMLEAEAVMLTNQARFICEICDGTLKIVNKKQQAIIDENVNRGYDSDPVKAWKLKQDQEAVLEESQVNSQVDKEESESTKGPDYNYLLGMALWTLTLEGRDELIRNIDEKQTELRILQAKTCKDLWREDLGVLLEKLDEVEEKERLEETADATAGDKKPVKLETMLSPKGRRVQPKIADETKKKDRERRSGEGEQGQERSG